jgi:hypothetical protein
LPRRDRPAILVAPIQPEIAVIVPLLALALAAEPPRLDTLAPHASGIALAEVVEVKEYDERPMDGNKGIRFKLKRVRGTGHFDETVDVVTDFGGLRPPGDVPKPSAPLKPDSLKKGERYWLAFSSRHDYERYNQGVIGFWPEKDKVSEVLEVAVKDDVYRWSPQYVPELKLSYGHVVEKDTWRIRAERDGKVLWEKALPGKPLDYHFGLFQSTGGSFEVQMPKCGHILFTESDARLEKDNEFGLPAGSYYVNNGLDPQTGKRHGTWVRVAQGPSVEVMNRAYDLDTGKPTRDERFEFLKSGGKAVGAKTEEWWRKVERTFDASGEVTKEAVFRYDESAEREKRWVKVKG